MKFVGSNYNFGNFGGQFVIWKILGLKCDFNKIVESNYNFGKVWGSMFNFSNLCGDGSTGWACLRHGFGPKCKRFGLKGWKWF